MTDTPTALPPPPDLTALPPPPALNQQPASPDLSALPPPPEPTQEPLARDLTQAEPPASMLLFLYADRFVPLEKKGKVGQRSLNSGQVVKTKDLAHHILCMAMWDLQRQGFIELEEYHEKKLGFVSVSGLRAKPGAPTSTSEGLVCFEGSLLKHLTADKHFIGPGARVKTTVKGSLPRSESPDASICATMASLALRFGCLTRETVDVTGLDRLLQGKTKAVAVEVPERIAALDAAAERLRGEWEAFVSDPSGLWPRLSEEVASGISATTETDYDDD